MTALIKTLKEKQEKFTEALNACTDEKVYDQINAEL